MMIMSVDKCIAHMKLQSFFTLTSFAVDVKGSESLPVKTALHEKIRIVVTPFSADGMKAMTFVILKRKNYLKEKVAVRIIFKYNQKFWITVLLSQV
jgi:hypothetical protein